MFAAHQGASPPPHMNNLPNGMLKFHLILQLIFTKDSVVKGRFLNILIFACLAHSGATVNQLLRRAAAAAAMRRERNSSSHSDELGMKRHRSDQGPGGGPGNNNNLDVLSHPPQITAADFSTNLTKHSNNNLSPQIKDIGERLDPTKLSIGTCISTRHFIIINNIIISIIIVLDV